MKEFNFALNVFLLDELTLSCSRLIDSKRDFDNSKDLKSQFLTFDDYVVLLGHLQKILYLAEHNASLCLDRLQTEWKQVCECSVPAEE